MLTQSRLREMLHYSEGTGVFVWLKAPGRNFKYRGKPAGYLGPDGYLYIGIDRAIYLAHRLAWFYVFDKWPDEQIDHVNRSKSDNKLSNLREANTVQNGHNVGLQSRNTSGVRGVDWRPDRARWRARLMVGKTDLSLGNFSDFFEAVCARKSAEHRHYGEYAPR